MRKVKLQPIAGVTTEQAARALGVHPAQVTRYIASGQLEATRCGNAWLVDLASLEALLRQRQAR